MESGFVSDANFLRPQAPVDLRCGGLDLNGNGIFECLATGPSSMMALINMDKRQCADVADVLWVE